MGITAANNFGDEIRKQMNQLKANFEQAIIFNLKELGEELVNCARLSHTYKDRTGNLTNSMGYVVVKGKEIVAKGGEQGGGEGEQAALQQYIERAKECVNQYTLIVVAGMEYATYVEAKGYNVLIPAELMCKAEFAPRMTAIVDKFNEKLSKLK